MHRFFQFTRGLFWFEWQDEGKIGVDLFHPSNISPVLIVIIVYLFWLIRKKRNGKIE